MEGLLLSAWRNRNFCPAELETFIIGRRWGLLRFLVLPVTPSSSITQTFHPASAAFRSASKTLQPDEKGKVVDGDDAFKVQVKRKKGLVTDNPVAKFIARFKRGDFSATLSGSGLTNSDVPRPGQSITVTVLILFNGTLYEQDAQLTYVAKNDRKGTAKGP